MTDPIMEEIFALSEQAVAAGQNRIDVHVFPFRMTETNLADQAASPWQSYWLNLKEAYDYFERTRVAPMIGVCAGKYIIGDPVPLGDPTSPIYMCSKDQEEPGGAQIVEAEPAIAKANSAHRVSVARQYVRRVVGRNTRKAYAAARRARMLVHARRMRTSSASVVRRTH
jgi:murein L,D-transpeptidase YafK